MIYTVGATFFPTWSPYKYTTITTGLGLGSSLVITGGLLGADAVAVPWAHDVVTVLPQLAYMSIVAAFVGVLCWNLGNKILTPLNGVLFMDVVPTTAFIVSASIQGIQPSPAQITGAATTATALVLNNIYLRHRMTGAPAPAAAAAPAPRLPAVQAAAATPAK